MNRRRSALAAAIVVLGIVVGIQLADPRIGGGSPPAVNYSDPPSKIATDAARQFDYIDYAYRLDFSRNRSGDWHRIRMLRVDHSDREYYQEGPLGQDGVVLYGTDAVTFVRPGQSSSWRVTFLRDVTFLAATRSEPFSEHELRNAKARIVGQNATMIIIKADVQPTKVAKGAPGTTTFYINKRSGIIQYATATYHPANNESLYLRFTLIDTNIDVKRPRGIPFSPRELLWDVLRGPIVDL